MRLRTLIASTLFVSAFGLFGAACGYSEEEWQAQLDKYNKLSAKNQETEARLAQLQKDLGDSKTRVGELLKKLKEMGVDLDKLNEDLQQKAAKVSELNASLEERERALAEYKARARQLEQIKARFEMLRKKLDELTKLGLAVNIRRNRMVISLPGDVLFDSGRETLKKEGQEILDKVAGVVRNDKTLLDRDYQVAGHTDSKPLGGGVFKDNWGLSLMRAREVLLYLQKVGMPSNHWSAAGFGDTDPVADNESEEGRKKNRRCDLIVVPSVEEMLDLKTIVQ